MNSATYYYGSACTFYYCDSYSFACTYYGYYWNIGGDVSGTTCCTDDAGENKEYFRVYSANTAEANGKLGGDDSGDDACCDSDYDCVYNSVCYTHNARYDLDGDGRLDYYCYNNGGGWWINVDYHTSYCSAAVGTGHWNIGGDAAAEDAYYTSTGSRTDYCTIGADGHPSTQCCCGDDTGEYYSTDDAYNTGGNTIGFQITTASCCDANDCVATDACYASTTDGGNFGSLTYLHGGLNPGGNDNYAFCYGSGGVDGGAGWLDCDTAGWYANWCANTAVCGNTAGVYAGESGVGEYPDTSTLGCCGDDNGENYCQENTYSQAIAFNNNEYVCCNAATDCVSGSTCYTGYSSYNTGGQYTGLNPGANDNGGYCYTGSGGIGKWLDCDQAGYMNTWCASSSGTICGKNYAGPGNNGACDTTQGGTASGESGAFGEYTSLGQCGCCGDDANENYIASAGSGNDGSNACCNSATDCVLSSTCYSSGQVQSGVYCSSGTWVDLDVDQSGCAAAGYDWLTGSITGSNGACCGDDTTSDDFYNGTIGSTGFFCYDGSFTQQAIDSNKTICEYYDYVWFLGDTTGDYPACCGDDSTSDNFNNDSASCIDGVLAVIDISLSNTPIIFCPTDMGEVQADDGIAYDCAGGTGSAPDGYPIIISINAPTTVNVDIHAKVDSDLTNNSNSIGISNLTFANTTSAARINATTEYQIVWSNVAPSSDNNVYWWLFIPPGTPALVYEADVKIKVNKTSA
jgi:hypothetical protein